MAYYHVNNENFHFLVRNHNMNILREKIAYSVPNESLKLEKENVPISVLDYLGSNNDICFSSLISKPENLLHISKSQHTRKTKNPYNNLLFSKIADQYKNPFDSLLPILSEKRNLPINIERKHYQNMKIIKCDAKLQLNDQRARSVSPCINYSSQRYKGIEKKNLLGRDVRKHLMIREKKIMIELAKNNKNQMNATNKPPTIKEKQKLVGDATSKINLKAKVQRIPNCFHGPNKENIRKNVSFSEPLEKMNTLEGQINV